MRYFKAFCSRTSRIPEDLAMGLGSIIEQNELKICRSYAEKPKQDENQFVKMIILDAIFIIELVLRNNEKLEEKQDEHILNNLDPTGKIRHLYCATKLDEAGVKFKAVQERSLLDIKFRKDRCLERCPFFNCLWLLNCLPCMKCVPCFEKMQPFLELPVFEVGNAAECVFRNIMALEQCHYPKQAFISSYILLLDYLINTEKDVDLLVERKAIVNRLGSDEAVAKLVNKLGHQIVECVNNIK
nr:hypothetical protein CFP56_17344 [Quercus suber]